MAPFKSFGRFRYPMVKKFEDTCNRFDRIPACDRQTDRQTDILRRHSSRYAYASKRCVVISCTITAAHT